MPPYSDQACALHFEDSFSSLSTLEDTDSGDLFKPLHLQEEDEARRPTRRNRGGRIVRFCDDHEIIESVHLNEMSQNEIDDYWLSCEELRAMKMDCLSLIGMIEDGLSDMLQEDDDLSLRGLEQHTGERGKQRILSKKQLFQEVFELQQGFAMLSGAHLEDLIAEASRRNSHVLRQEALEQGQLDALVIHKRTKL